MSIKDDVESLRQAIAAKRRIRFEKERSHREWVPDHAKAESTLESQLSRAICALDFENHERDGWPSDADIVIGPRGSYRDILTKEARLWREAAGEVK